MFIFIVRQAKADVPGKQIRLIWALGALIS